MDGSPSRSSEKRRAYWPMVWFADFSLLFLVEALGANAPLAEFVHPAVMEIREYDREHEGDYLLTLRTYLANGKDLLPPSRRCTSTATRYRTGCIGSPSFSTSTGTTVDF